MTRPLIAITFLSALVFSPMTLAQRSPLYLGIKAGLMDADISGFDSAKNIGVTIGYDVLDTPYGTWSLEGEITTSAAEGNIASGGEWDADTIAAYAVLCTHGEIYLKTRFGYLNQDIQRSRGTRGSGDDNGLALGIAAGKRLSHRSSIELAYTASSDELSFASVDYVYQF